jgi:hypothetical protein
VTPARTSRPCCSGIDEIIRQTEALERAERGEQQQDGIATIHGSLRIKPGVRREDLRVDGHRRLGGLTWIAEAEADRRDPDGFARAAQLLDGEWASTRDADAGEVVVGVDWNGWSLQRTLALDEAGPGLRVRTTVRPPATGGPWLVGSEWNLLVGHTGDDLTLEGGGAAPAGSGEALPGRPGWREGVDCLRFTGGGGRSLQLECSPRAAVAWAPVHTISSSEGGLEKTGQGSVFLITWLVSGPTALELRLRPHAPHCEDDPR